MFDSEFKSTKHTFVCDPDECDTLAEITTSDRFGFPSGVIQNTCPCGRQMSLVSSTIEENPTKERLNPVSEETTILVPETYNPNALVTYKNIDNGEVTYPTIKVTSLEAELEYKKALSNNRNELQSKVNRIIDNLTGNHWYNPNTDKDEVLSELCEILGHEPKQTIRITATVQVEVDYEIPMEDVDGFDAHYFLQYNLSSDSWHGDVTVDSFDVQDADVDWS